MASQADGSEDVIDRFRGAMGTSPPMNPAAPPAAVPSSAPGSPERSSQQRSEPSPSGAGSDDDEGGDNLLRMVTQLTSKEAEAKKTAEDNAAKDRAIAVAKAPNAAAEGGEGSSVPLAGSFFGPASYQAVSPPMAGSPLPNAGVVSPGASTTSNVWNTSIPGYPAGTTAAAPAQSAAQGASRQTFNVSAAPFHGSANPSLGSTPLAAGQFSQHPPLPPPPQYPGTPPAAGAPAPAPANVLVRNGHGVFLLTLAHGTPTAGPAAPPSASSGAPHPFASTAAGRAAHSVSGARGGRGGGRGTGQQGSPAPSTAAGAAGQSPPPMAMPPPMSATTARPADTAAKAAPVGAAAGDLPPTHLPSGEPNFARTRRGGKGGARGGKAADAPAAGTRR